MNELEKLTVGSLFSGIGGLELGLERTRGFRTVWNSEIDPYASAVLRKHWPSVPNLGDITRVKWETVERPDLICGGFPCQDISTAGKGAGIKEGTRSGLWFEFLKSIQRTEPTWVIAENVGAITARGLGTVLEGLRCAGYETFRPILFEAYSVGAIQKRERCFVVAHTNEQLRVKILRGKSNDAGGFVASNTHSEFGKRNVRKPFSRFEEFKKLNAARSVEDLKGRADIPEPLIRRNVYGVSCGVDRIKCLGNAVVPQVAQVIGEAILQNEMNTS